MGKVVIKLLQGSAVT